MTLTNVQLALVIAIATPCALKRTVRSHAHVMLATLAMVSLVPLSTSVHSATTTVSARMLSVSTRRGLFLVRVTLGFLVMVLRHV